MRTIITILFLLCIKVSACGQTRLDTLLFNKINMYRISLRLNAIKWDTCAYKAAEHHSAYMKREYKYTHSEDTLISYYDRYEYYGGKTQFVSEIITGASSNFVDTDPLIDEKLSISILEKWKGSKPHNKILVDPDNVSIGCSSKIIIMEQGIRGRKYYMTFSTAVLTYKY